ncbi:MAG: hypothetical protein AAGA45_06880 [Verrucomicrobiota bacterium]
MNRLPRVLLYTMPVLALLYGCEDKSAKEAAESEMAQGIENLQEGMEKQKEAAAAAETGPYDNPDQVSGDVLIINKLLDLDMEVPTPAWTVSIDEVYIVGDEMWAIAALKEKQGAMSPQVITQVENRVIVKDVPNLPVTYYVLGKTFGWMPQVPANVKFIESTKAIASELETGEKVYPQ